MDIKQKNKQKELRKKRNRAQIKSARSFRLSVFRSNKYIYAQLIDDRRGVTIVSFNDMNIGKKNKIESSREVGRVIGKLATEKNVKAVVFDRGHYKYHGRVKSLAEGARESGLEF